jgi:hypothetical protein
MVGWIAALVTGCAGSAGESDGSAAADATHAPDRPALESDHEGEEGDEGGAAATSADLDERIASDDGVEVDTSLEFGELAALEADRPRERVAATYADCPVGNICFYTGRGGFGSMCRWTEHDTDWNSGSTVCSWADTSDVCSVWNRTSWRMEYFKRSRYRDRVGSTLSGVRGDLACTYRLASHRKQL